MGVTVVSTQPLPAGTAFSRLVMALARARGDSLWAATQAEHFRDTPQVSTALHDWINKAATPPGSVTDTGWAGPLAPYRLNEDALLVLRGLSVYEQLAPQMIRVPVHASIPHETPSAAAGSWLGENQPVPITTASFTTVLMEYFKIAAGSVLTSELVRFSTPAAEAIVRRIVLGKLAYTLDQNFLLPGVSALAGVGPASITNGATEVTSTGSTAAAIATDLAALLTAVTTPGPFVWIMQPATMNKIALTVSGSATVDLPRTLAAAPVIASTNSPRQIVLVDPKAILYADEGAFTVEVTTEATIQVDSTPTAPTAATIQRSVWAENESAIKAIRWLNFKRIVPTGVAWMTTAY
jgi:HK97 family phage major capsid protein